MTMILTKTQLIGKIYKAFEGVVLEDGVGLWEGQALDDRLENTAAYERLRAKDERLDWQKIPIVRLYECSSSISFHDAKGMRFHLPLYLLFALYVFMDEEEELHEDKDFTLWPPEIQFALTHNLESDYSKSRFSLLNTEQIACIVHFLEYTKGERERHCKQYRVKQNHLFNKNHEELKEAIAFWKVKALVP
ncbi:Hypothetical protein I595_943 [Croceitalea dokdonensis DOKDO 023]|uniref:Uncharacterized protein n=1 Tax=Croceitalea dokdonensis DOKDO 023 TaxID=1300341 RepID=A0A0P7B2M0_9FLAO|nr:DUF6714 family protein [Croceitalea dokdonensis]KPM32525.1 Hypothetical protein I595_943 [Croceitalea dokdonensis DOKDO 023]